MTREIAFDPQDRQQMLGLAGSVVVALGVFAPLVRVPFLGHLTYFQNGQGDGVIVLFCAGAGLFLSLFRNFKGTLGAGLASVGLLVFTFIRIQVKMAEMQAEMQQKLAGNPFRGLAEATMGSVQFEWGWGVLLVGGGLMVASGLVGNVVGRRSCPHCAEQILVAASMCRFCRRAVDPAPHPESHSGVSTPRALTDMTECPQCHQMMSSGTDSCGLCGGRLHEEESRARVPVPMTMLETHATDLFKKPTGPQSKPIAVNPSVRQPSGSTPSWSLSNLTWSNLRKELGLAAGGFRMEPLPKMVADLPVCPKCGTDIRVWFKKVVPRKTWTTDADGNLREGPTPWDGVCPSCKTARHFKVGAAVVGGSFAGLCMVVVALPSGNGRSGGDCGSAHQEVQQRLAAGRLTDGAVARLANCRPSSLPVDGDAMRDALKAQAVADQAVAAAAEKRTRDLLKRTQDLVPRTEPSPAAVPVSPPAKEPNREPAVASASPSGEKLISMDFKDAEVVNLLRILAAESGRNIVAGDDVKGRLSIALKNVTWEHALDTILEVRGLSKVERNGVIFVRMQSRKSGETR